MLGDGIGPGNLQTLVDIRGVFHFRRLDFGIDPQIEPENLQEIPLRIVEFRHFAEFFAVVLFAIFALVGVVFQPRVPVISNFFPVVDFSQEKVQFEADQTG